MPKRLMMWTFHKKRRFAPSPSAGATALYYGWTVRDVHSASSRHALAAQGHSVHAALAPDAAVCHGHLLLTTATADMDISQGEQRLVIFGGHSVRRRAAARARPRLQSLLTHPTATLGTLMYFRRALLVVFCADPRLAPLRPRDSSRARR